MKEKNSNIDSKETGLIFDIQRYCVHDGPGIRTLVFMKGCPLRCLWCSNPESQNAYPEIVFIEKNCIQCEKCYHECPSNAIQPKTFHIFRDLCNNCGKCVQICPAASKKIIGKHVSIPELIEEIETDRLFYINSGGGVTVGGGEPTLQYPFVSRFLEECQKINIHTAIETCGFVEWTHFEQVLKSTDLVLFDIKCMNVAKHQELTEQSNKIILQNAKRASSMVSSMIIRMPIIPGYNDSYEDIYETVKFSERLNKIKKIELLLYHSLGEYKYKWLGRKYTLDSIQLPSYQYQENLQTTIKNLKSSIEISIT